MMAVASPPPGIYLLPILSGHLGANGRFDPFTFRESLAPVSRILLAEDDTTMRTFLARALERAGHEVFAVGDGMEALAAARTVQFDMLVADVVMPSLDGFQLAARARAAYPDLRVMFITGFAAVSLRGRDTEFSGAKVLSKPFHLRELVDRVHEILHAQTSAL